MLVAKYETGNKELNEIKAEGDKIAQQLSAIEEEFTTKNAKLTAKGKKLREMQDAMKGLNQKYVDKVKAAEDTVKLKSEAK